MSDVSTPSLDYMSMQPYWAKVSSILGGVSAMRAQKQFLPKFPNESKADYEFRRENAKFTNVWRDIVENLAAKPFAEELSIDASAPEELQDLMDDVNGQGDHFHVFGAQTFFYGLAYGLHWVFIDVPKRPEGVVSIADEKRAGIKPYWISLKAEDVLAVETQKIGSKNVITHCRFRANAVERDGFKENVVERIREYNREENGSVKYQVWQKNKEKWELTEDKGSLSINEIPLVPFISGRNQGSSLVVDPMLSDAADLQIELYQQESGLKYAKESTAFPMLAGNGVTPPTGDDGKPQTVPVGPKTVLYAPSNAEGEHGEWKFIEPDATALKFLAEDIKETITQLRELGRQPLTSQTGNLTTVTTAFAAQKGNSAILAASILFKDAMESCLRITTKWMGQEQQINVNIYSDFDLDIGDDQGPQTLNTARAAGDLSQETYWAELKRRRILGPNFDPDDEKQALAEEIPDPDDLDDQLGSIPPLRGVA
jgi:hypothetical protein